MVNTLPAFGQVDEAKSERSYVQPIKKEDEKEYRIWEALIILNDSHIKIPKPVLDSLDRKFEWLRDQVIDLTKSDLDNLILLIKESEQSKDYSKLEETIRKEIIEEQVEKWDVKLEILCTWAKWVFSKEVLEWVWKMIDHQLAKVDYLTDNQKENIKIWIVGKIIHSWEADNIIKKLSDPSQLADKSSYLITDWDTIIGNNMKDILKLLENAKDNPEAQKLLTWLLSSPQAIEDYTDGANIDITKLSPEDLLKQVVWLNNDVLNQEFKWWKKKEQLTAQLSKLPSWMAEFMLGILQSIIGVVVWKEWAEKIIWWMKKEIENRKSVDKLLKYWKTTNEKWEIVSWENDTIGILRDKNLDWLESKKLSKFFDKCRSKWIDINSDDFWENVLKNKSIKTEVKEEPKKDANWAEIKVKTQEYTFKEVWYDVIKWPSEKPDFTDFYKVLNASDFITDKTKETENQTTAAEKAKKEKTEQIDALKKEIEGLITQKNTITSEQWEIEKILKNGKIESNELYKKINWIKAIDIKNDNSPEFNATLWWLWSISEEMNKTFIPLFKLIKIYMSEPGMEKSTDTELEKLLVTSSIFQKFLNTRHGKNKETLEANSKTIPDKEAELKRLEEELAKLPKTTATPQPTTETTLTPST